MKGNKGIVDSVPLDIFMFILDYGTEVTKDRELREKYKFLSEPNIVITHINDSFVSRI
jgi:hypothetical protein